MKKVTVLLLILLVSACGMADEINLRRCIAIVSNQPDSALSAQLRSYSLQMSYHKQSAASRYLTSITRNGFGSGFVVESNGRQYIVTNSHVVGIGSTAEVKFNFDKKTLNFDSCRCVYQNDKTDIALLELPSFSSEISALQLDVTPALDGQDVFSAGYPAIGGTPSWQFSKGIVSNAELMFSDSAITYVQHTAQVDKGSSGSPLLRNDDGYKVIGINTQKVSNREGVGIAVPAENISEAIANIGYNDMAPALQQIRGFSVDTYAIAYSKMPVELVQKQNSMLANGEYLDAIILVKNYADTADLKKTKNRIDPVTITETRYSIGKGTVTEVHVTPTQKGVDRDYNRKNILGFGVDKYLNDKGIKIMLSWEYIINVFGRMGFELTVAPKTLGSPAIVSPGIVGGVQVPYYTGRFYLVPYFTPVIGAAFFHSGVATRAGAQAGLDFTFTKRPLFAGVMFDFTHYHHFHESRNYFLGGAGIKLGITW